PHDVGTAALVARVAATREGLVEAGPTQLDPRRGFDAAGGDRARCPCAQRVDERMRSGNDAYWGFPGRGERIERGDEASNQRGVLRGRRWPAVRARQHVVDVRAVADQQPGRKREIDRWPAVLLEGL